MCCACDHVHNMKMIQIRNVPDELHQALKIRAAREGVTMSELILRELPRIANRPSLDEVLTRIRSREPVRGLPSGAELVREVREERDARH
jgi:plasmid stability protein